MANLAALVAKQKLSFDAAAGCAGLIADSHKMPHTACNRMHTASILCRVLRQVAFIDPAFSKDTYFLQSAAYFTRIFPHVSHIPPLCCKCQLINQEDMSWQ